MRLGDILYFAPGVRFGDVDLQGTALPEQYGQRMAGFYIAPAEECSARDQAFAAGALLVTCIDALARLRFGGGVGARFRRFAREELASFGDAGLAERFYDEFRNGLVHEGRLKDGAQFSLEVDQTVKGLQGLLLVNPALLAGEVRAALDAHVALLGRDAAARKALAQSLAKDHARDFAAATV